MTNIHMAVAVAQQTEDERRKMPPDELIKKAWKVVNSCQTSKQAEIAMKYLDLLAETHSDLDVGPLRKELAVLFDWTSK